MMHVVKFRWSTVGVLFMLVFAVFFSGCFLQEPDNEAPVVSILNPGDGDVVTGNVSIVATASDDVEVRTLKILIDGQEVTSVDGDFATYEWDTSVILDNLNHTVAAYAIDKDDNIGAAALANVQVTDSPLLGAVPTVGFVFPSPNANNIFSRSATGTIQVVADADDDKSIDRVEFFIDGALVSTVTDADPLYRYDWDISNVQTDIDHTIYIIAYDTENNSAAALVAVNIVD